MYPRNMRGSWGKVSGLYTYYVVLNRLFRKTLTPRDGNTSDVTLFQRNLSAILLKVEIIVRIILDHMFHEWMTDV